MQVLVVCTANVARSPLAEAMIRAELAPTVGAADDGDLEVSSAGTRAREGSPAAPESVELGRLRGLDLAAHRSRPLTAELVAGADLVLTMSERQRDAATPLAPGMAGRVFTLREFDRLTAAVDAARAPQGPVAERLAWWRDQAHLARPIASRARGKEDVADPIGKPWPAWETLGELFDEVLPRLGARIRG